jgi:predicted RNA-binding Zn-ribbon protein involved in translation (DUF1610 family)
MTDPSPIPPTTPAPAPDATCISCGYPIDKLAPNGVCPECGTPLSASRRAVHLRDSSLDYLQTLRRGVILQIAAVIALIAAGPAQELISNIAFSRGMSIVELILTLAGVYGVWLLASPDPARELDHVFTKLTRRARAWAITDGCSQTAATLLLFFVTGPAAELGAEVLALSAYGSMLAVAMVVANLGTRADDAVLTGHARALHKVGVIMLVFYAAIIGIEGIGLLSTAVAGVMYLLITLPGIAVLVVAIIMMVRYIAATVRILKTLAAAIEHARNREQF